MDEYKKYLNDIINEEIDEELTDVEENIDWDPVLKETKIEDCAIQIFLEMKDYCENLGFNNLILEKLNSNDILRLIS